MNERKELKKNKSPGGVGLWKITFYIALFFAIIVMGNTTKVDASGTTQWLYEDEGRLLRYYKDGVTVKNQFVFNGYNTYYLQADGSPMRNRLTYHPDGKNVIYFDQDGHEAFNKFVYCADVGYICYFGGYGYAYFDQITFYKDKAYYLNASGKMEQNGWFQFANGVDYGYANGDGTLHNEGFSYDPWGRVVFYHWNGMVARGLISDGVWYYLMDEKDGHYLGQFLVNPNVMPPEPAHVHSYTETVVKASTCHVDGLMRYTCSCGDTYDKRIPSTGHDYVIYSYKEQTCTQDGHRYWRCTKCNERIPGDFPARHYYEVTESKEATCTTDGYKKYTCIKCKKSYTETSKAVGHHTPGKWTVSKSASTTPSVTASDFGKRVTNCTVCKEKMEEVIITLNMGSGKTKQVSGAFDDAMAQQVFSAANAYRQTKGLTKLTWNSNWNDLCKIRTAEFSVTHSSMRTDGSDLTYNGETLKEDFGINPNNVQEIITFMNRSPEYNLLNKPDITKGSVACFKVHDGTSYTLYWLQLFQ